MSFPVADHEFDKNRVACFWRRELLDALEMHMDAVAVGRRLFAELHMRHVLLSRQTEFFFIHKDIDTDSLFTRKKRDSLFTLVLNKH